MILEDILNNLKNKEDTYLYINKEGKYTYREMYRYVCNLYNNLKETTNTIQPIIVYGHKEYFMEVAFLVCAFLGIAYIPIDNSLPKERIYNIIEQTNPQLIIGEFEHDKVINIGKEKLNKILNIDKYTDITEIKLKSDDILYIIFTSGTTGNPKGVKVTYENLESCIRWLQKITYKNNEVILNQASFSFDLSIADTYLALVNGKTHYMLEDDIKKDFPRLFQKLAESKAELAVMTPSFAEYLLIDKNFNNELMINLKQVIFCGEKLRLATIKKLKQRFNNLKIINSYGPTECTFAVTSMMIENEILSNDNIPIGYVKDDTQIYIVDNEKNVLKENEIGEILIIGKSVAKGYVGNETGGFIQFYGQKGYLTGDIGYINKKIVYYIKRKDEQVKYKGYRIELLDIENNINSLKYVERCVIIAKEDNNTKIYGFIKLNEEKTIEEIKEDLLRKMPEYMCPIIKIVDKFYLNQNGKCDKNKLIEEYL